MRIGQTRTHRLPSRRSGVLVATFAAALMAVTGCSGSQQEVVITQYTTPGAPTPAVTVPASTAPAASAPAAGPSSTAAPSAIKLADKIRVESKPKFGSKDIAPAEPVTLTVFSGKIADLTVTGDDGSTVEGKIADDGATFSLTERMAYGIKYTFAGKAVASDGTAKAIKGELSTVNPDSTIRAGFQREISNGETVGVAAPIVITFFEPVKDKAAAEETFVVTTDKGEIEGSWAWLQDEDVQGSGTKWSRAHFRPKEYWPSNTKVHVEANLAGVDLGSGWGREDIVADFKIGRKQIAIADVNSFHLVVMVDDLTVANYPVSYGKDTDPGRVTRSGIHVVTEKHPTFKMCNPKYGYCGLEVKWAVRIQNNGEFIHANEQVERSGQLGRANVSHGCVNMSLADAEKYFNSSLYGDPVEVKNTGVELSPQDGELFDWTYSWENWKSFSALAS